MTCGCVCCVVEGEYPPGVVRCSFCGSSLVSGTGKRMDGYWTVYRMVYRTVCRKRVSGLTAPIFRPRRCCFPDGLWTVPGGFTDGLSDIAVSAFNVVVVRFCGSFCLVLMPPLSGFENRPFLSRLVRPARCGSSCSLALRGEGSGNAERK